MLRKVFCTTCLLCLLALPGVNDAQAEVLLAEDFFYGEPNKPVNSIQGFEFQDYGGGFGSWGGQWAAVLNATITGPSCLEPECLGDGDLYQGVVSGGNNHVLERTYALDGSAGDVIYFGGMIREEGENVISRAAIYLQGGEVTNFNNVANIEVSQHTIGVGLFECGFRGILGDLAIDAGPDAISNDGLFHTVIGKLEINADGANERLTVWLDPTGAETGPNMEVVDGVDVISSAADLASVAGTPFRLWTNTGLIHFDNVAAATTWDEVANAVVPRLTLEVDQSSGVGRIKNDSGVAFDTIFLSIESASGSLVENGWNGLADQATAGWAKNRSNTSQLVESVFQGSTTIDAGANIPIGVVWNMGGEADLNAEFGTAGGLLNRMDLTFVDGGLMADFNGDGSVDAADASVMFANWEGSGVGDIAGSAEGGPDGLVDAADAGKMFAEWTGDHPEPGAGDATAEYNTVSGQILISANGVVNVFVESASGGLSPGNSDAAPAGLLASDNASRVGLTGFGGINVTNWKSQNSAGLAPEDLSLVVGPALGVPSVTHAAGSANFRYIPEPATASLLGLGLLGLLTCRRRG